MFESNHTRLVKTIDSPLSEPSSRLWRYDSASFLESLATASLVGMVAAGMGIAASFALYRFHVSWFMSVGSGPVVTTLVVIASITIALERVRKRTIRRTLERAFLGHHVHNSLSQMILASNLIDPVQHDRYTREAVSRISEALFRVANNSARSLSNLTSREQN